MSISLALSQTENDSLKFAIQRSRDKLWPNSILRPSITAGAVVFVSGQRGAENGVVVSGGAPAELRQAFRNIAKILENDGLTLADIAKVTLFIVDLAKHFSSVDDEYLRVLPRPLPARTVVGINALTGGALVAVDVIATRRR